MTRFKCITQLSAGEGTMHASVIIVANDKLPLLGSAPFIHSLTVPCSSAYYCLTSLGWNHACTLLCTHTIGISYGVDVATATNCSYAPRLLAVRMNQFPFNGCAVNYNLRVTTSVNYNYIHTNKFFTAITSEHA